MSSDEKTPDLATLMKSAAEWLPPKDVDVVVYHAGCPDGASSAWVACRSVSGRLVEPRALEHTHASFHGLFSVCTGRNVAMIDIAPKTVQDLESLTSACKRLVVLDHHKTSMDVLGGHEGCFFHMDHSGAMMAWRYFNGEDEPLEFLKYVEDRDLWRFKYGDDTRDFAAGFAFDKLLDHDTRAVSLAPAEDDFVRQTIGAGKAVRAQEAFTIQRHLDHGQARSLKKRPCFVVNATTLVSETGNCACTANPQCDFSLVWRYEMSKRACIVSLRSDKTLHPDFDCASFASEHFGGGGHAQAAGFSVPGADIETLFDQDDVSDSNTK
jgi:oligoribonuclease NrnB/cAMP/cGMP phosphodiesterase (DHH superfamily)